MIKDRPFNISFLISFVWHIAVISVVVIVVTPAVSKLRNYQEVNFLGPILEKTAFELMADRAEPTSEALYKRSPVSIDHFQLKVKGPARKVVKEVFPPFLEERFRYPLSGYFAGTKEVPRYFAEETREIYAGGDGGRYPLIEGAVRSRRILYRPEPPKVSGAFYGKEFIIKLKFYVSDEGEVKSIEPIISSGFPEVDLIGIRYLKRWRFAPVSVVETKKSQSGKVVIRLKAEW